VSGAPPSVVAGRLCEDAGVLREILPPDTALAFPAMRELRPHLAGARQFTEQVDRVQRPAGYRLVGAFEDGEPDAVAVAGFRLSTNLAWGRHLYVDDLSTLLSARGRGWGRQLLEWLQVEAARSGCLQVHLDSGVGEDRQTAHRLYFSSGYRISSYHFLRSV
jgi:GNAT superfamily N-acetyltransferase